MDLCLERQFRIQVQIQSQSKRILLLASSLTSTLLLTRHSTKSASYSAECVADLPKRLTCGIGELSAYFIYRVEETICDSSWAPVLSVSVSVTAATSRASRRDLRDGV